MIAYQNLPVIDFKKIIFQKFHSMSIKLTSMFRLEFRLDAAIMCRQIT